MKDEIKEILDKAKEISKYGDDGKQHTRFFNQFEAKSLLDYITNLQKYYNDNVNKYEELLVKYSNLQEENKRLNNVINELKNGLKEEIDRLEKVALENKNNKFEFDKLVLIRGKVIDIYDELIYEIYENKWKKIEKE